MSTLQNFDVVVTGSAGHLGHALMLYLPSLGYRPLGVDILPSKTTNFVGSFTDRAFISHIFSTNPSVKYVIHAGGLHKPHIISHTNEDFIETNVTGTWTLLDEFRKSKNAISFIFASTTSAFGSVLSPMKGESAIWVDEQLVPAPKNIYGISKIAAEDICYIVHKQTNLPILVLRFSRFFPQPEDNDMRRNSMSNDNLKILELCYRRVDIRDAADGCVAAMQKAPEIGWGRYVISAPTPFQRNQETLERLNSNASDVLKEVLPGCAVLFEQKNWKFLGEIDRVYDSTKAQKELGWKPKITIQTALEKVGRGEEWRSELATTVGRRGYHAVSTAFYTSR